MGYSAFQKASIDKICEHFEKHNRVICADEAGLGKTYIARGVIEKLADKKLESILKDDSVISECENWLKSFEETNSFGSNKSKASNRKNRFEMFARLVTLDREWKLKDREKFKDAVERVIVNNEEYKKDRIAYWFRFIKNLSNLLVAYNETKGGSERKEDWDYDICQNCFPEKLKKNPYRVLYICSNIAIAEQNAGRLSAHNQCAIRHDEKPDRLSLLWYYLEKYPTPYLELLPISYTLAKETTQGTLKERDLLKRKFGCNKSVGDIKLSGDEKELRNKGEKVSLKINYDLVIFDEFQNFGNAISLINQRSEKVTILVKKRKKGENDDVEKLKKLYEICKNLYPNGKDKTQDQKTLFLSATPFKDIDSDLNSFSHISLDDIIMLLGGDIGCYNARKTSKEKADYLYELGIFRNERKNLLSEYTPDVNRVPCTSRGVLTNAALIKGVGQGNKAMELIRYCPEPYVTGYSSILDNYEGVSQKKGLVPSKYPMFDRMEKLKRIVYAAKAPAAGKKQECVFDPLNTKISLNQLLWIPPVNPSHPLSGIFADYKYFSKSFIFTTDLQAVSQKITELFNYQIKYDKLDINDELVKELAEYYKDVFWGDKTLSERFVKMIDEYGQRAINNTAGNNIVEKIKNYCENGCLKDVIMEFTYLYGENSKSEMVKIFEFMDKDYSEYAMELTQDRLAASDKGATLRRNFNSPFGPFVITTTTIGTEGIDFHLYCDRLIHYCPPKSFIDWEQKNGRIDRRDSLAVRRWWSKPENYWKLLQYEKIEQESGGLSPHWNSGDGGLHYYYLYVEGTKEEEEFMKLEEKVKNSRLVLGSDGRTLQMYGDEIVNLSPYIRERKY